MIDPVCFLQDLLDAAIASAMPDLCLPPFLPPYPTQGRVIVIGAGKASAAMARVVEDCWNGPLEGLVITRYGHGVPCDRIEIMEAAHPVPDAAGVAATARILKVIGNLTEEDLVLCLISGGGSALLTLPLDGITLADKQAVNRALLASGATISEINCLRRHLSAVKGGRLAAACHPARVLTLMISDVPGDDPVNIASGPTVADPTTRQDALEIVRRYALDLPAAVLSLLEDPRSESLKPGDARLARSTAQIIAAPQQGLEAAAGVARTAGVTPHILSDSLEGDSREVGQMLAALARQVKARGQPFVPPCVLLSGGETTVTLKGSGRGGPNAELILSMAITLGGTAGVYALAADTDGVDGAAEIAGAICGPETLTRAAARGNNNAHGFFEALNDQVLTGPTLTNVNDFRAILIQ
ncbi:MAG: glycerate kinase type-2 family protein [Magnetospiraceae bacterium]